MVRTSRPEAEAELFPGLRSGTSWPNPFKSSRSGVASVTRVGSNRSREDSSGFWHEVRAEMEQNAAGMKPALPIIFKKWAEPGIEDREKFISETFGSSKNAIQS